MGVDLRGLGAVALAGLCLLAPVPAQAEDAETERAWSELVTDIRASLEELSTWCQRSKCFGARTEIDEAILVLAPDDEEVRGRLDYTRAGDGTWTRPADWREPRNHGMGIRTLPARREALADAYVDRIANFREDARLARAHRLRARAAEVALAIAPEYTRFREMNGEVRDDPRPGRRGDPPWVLDETVRARTRHAKLIETATEAVRDLPDPEAGQLTEAEARRTFEWSPVLMGPRVRMVGTPPSTELEQALRYAEATWPLFEEAFARMPGTYRSNDRYARGLSIYAFETVDDGNAFLADEPTATQRYREFVGPLVATWVPNRPAVVVKSPHEATRLEAAPRQVLAAHCGKTFGLRDDRGWLSHGLGLYLTWLITGTRLINAVTDVESAYATGDRPIPEWEAKLRESDADWLELGRLLMESGDKPNLHLLAGTHLNDVDKAGVLYSYCIVAYMVEGHPDACTEVFQRLMSQEAVDLDAAFLELLGHDTDAFEARLLRWLEERRR